MRLLYAEARSRSPWAAMGRKPDRGWQAFLREVTDFHGGSMLNIRSANSDLQEPPLAATESDPGTGPGRVIIRGFPFFVVNGFRKPSRHDRGEMRKNRQRAVIARQTGEWELPARTNGTDTAPARTRFRVGRAPTAPSPGGVPVSPAHVGGGSAPADRGILGLADPVLDRVLVQHQLLGGRLVAAPGLQEDQQGSRAGERGDRRRRPGRQRTEQPSTAAGGRLRASSLRERPIAETPPRGAGDPVSRRRPACDATASGGAGRTLPRPSPRLRRRHGCRGPVFVIAAV